MWWKDKPLPAALRNSRLLFGGDGRLRVWWKLLVAAVCWYVGRLPVNTALLWLLSRLFRLWGLNAANLSLAPVWMQTLSRWSVPLCAAVTDLLTAAILLFPLRVRFGRKRTFIAALIVSCAGTLLLSLGFLALDSLRLLEKVPRFTWDVPVLLLTGFCASPAQGLAVFGFAFRELKGKMPRPVAHLLCAALFFAVSGGYRLGIMGMVNVLLLGAALSVAAERWSVGCAVGLQTGLLWASTALLSYPDCAGQGLFTLYAVSENWLTGGKGGLTSSTCLTAACILFLAFHFLHKNNPSKP